MKLNLGCGYKKLKGFINVDRDPAMKPDILLDLKDPLPFEDSSIDEVLCEQVLEHLSNYTDLIFEIHRVLKPEGKVEFAVPKFGCLAAVADPDHVRFFIAETFMHFCNPKWYNPSNFRGRGLFDWVESEERKWKYEQHDVPGDYFTELRVKLRKANGKYNDKAISKACVYTVTKKT